jgi:peroxin-4
MTSAATSSSTPNAQTRRLLKDLDSYYKDPLPFIQNLQYSVSPEGFNQLHGVLIGPEHSSYENGHFHFRIQFPLEYPFKPHFFYFLTRICHPNVQTETGQACHDELISSWTPHVSIRTILSKMHALLARPDYKKYYEQIFVPGKDPDVARQWTEEYAKPVS